MGRGGHEEAARRSALLGAKILLAAGAAAAGVVLAQRTAAAVRRAAAAWAALQQTAELLRVAGGAIGDLQAFLTDPSEEDGPPPVSVRQLLKLMRSPEVLDAAAACGAAAARGAAAAVSADAAAALVERLLEAAASKRGRSLVTLAVSVAAREGAGALADAVLGAMRAPGGSESSMCASRAAHAAASAPQPWPASAEQHDACEPAWDGCHSGDGSTWGGCGRDQGGSPSALSSASWEDGSGCSTPQSWPGTPEPSVRHASPPQRQHQQQPPRDDEWAEPGAAARPSGQQQLFSSLRDAASIVGELSRAWARTGDGSVPMAAAAQAPSRCSAASTLALVAQALRHPEIRSLALDMSRSSAREVAGALRPRFSWRSSQRGAAAAGCGGTGGVAAP